MPSLPVDSLNLELHVSYSPLLLTHILQRCKARGEHVQSDGVERLLVCPFDDLLRLAQLLRIQSAYNMFVSRGGGSHDLICSEPKNSDEQRALPRYNTTTSTYLPTFSKWLVRQNKLVHHVATAMRLSTMAPLTEYASRSGSLMLSTNVENVSGFRRDSSSSGNVVENLL